MIALVNAIFTPRLPGIIPNGDFPLVSILIPARNEENTIGGLLDDLNGFGYKNLEILVYDDHSEDRTSDIVRLHKAKNQDVGLIKGKELPFGWLGKNHACDCLAREAKGKYLLFLDADVRVKDGLLEKSIFYLMKYRLKLLSIFPKQEMLTTGEKISVPVMNWILVSLLPLFLIRISGNASFSAANGQFMLFDANEYKRIQPHSLYRKHRVEDIAIIRHYKETGLKTATLLGDEFIRCRMYTGLKDALNGFSKNVFQFFGNRMWITILFSLATTFTPFLAFFFCGIQEGILIVLLILLLRILVSFASRQPILANVLLAVPQHIVFLLIVIKAIANHFNKRLIWKGRNVS